MRAVARFLNALGPDGTPAILLTFPPGVKPPEFAPPPVIALGPVGMGPFDFMFRMLLGAVGGATVVDAVGAIGVGADRA